jgi:hypothetical protein
MIIYVFIVKTVSKYVIKIKLFLSIYSAIDFTYC